MSNLLHHLTILSNATIREALKKIDSAMLGLLFVVDSKNTLLGVITDGDIRRALLQGYTLKDKVKKAANFKPTFVYEEAIADTINALLANSKIKILPVVTKAKKLINYIKFDQQVHFPVAQPIFQGNELRYITNAVLTGWVSSAGKYITKFEEEFATFCKVKYAIACANGTTALHLALLSLGIGPGDEVIVPSLTFIATVNAVKYVGATPVLVDVEKEYWQIDPKKIVEVITKKTKAIIPVHLYGHPAKMDDIKKIARHYKLFIIEDAAEALGAEVKGKVVGSWGDLGTFSFYGNKIITTGEGGMVTTNSKHLADKIRVLRDHGMSKKRRYWHEVLGYNYRMTNLQAALGLAQLENIQKILTRKIEIARWYNRYLANIPGLSLQREAPWAKNVYWMFCVLVKNVGHPRMSRESLIKYLDKEGVETRPFFVPVHLQPIYSEYKKLKLPQSEELSAQGLNLPSSINLRESDIQLIAQKIKKLIV